MTGNQQSLTIVTVTFNSSAVLPEMLASIPDDVPLLIVDNGSQDINHFTDITQRSGVKVIRNKENVGFGRACNQAVAQINTDLVLFLNPDTLILDKAIDHLVAASTKYPEASAFGPAIVRANGKPYFRRSSVIVSDSKKMPKGWPTKDCEVPILSGSALMVRVVDFNLIKGFDKNIFMYHEDDDLCLRLKSRCGPLMFIRRAQVLHHFGNSSGSSPMISYLRGKYMGQSRMYASLKHRKKMAFLMAILSALANLCLIPRLFSPQKRAKSFGFLVGVIGARKRLVNNPFEESRHL